MDRRTLLTGLSTGAIWLGISSCVPMALNRLRPENGDITSPLGQQLAELANPLFHEYSATRSVDALHSEMVYKGVISPHHGIDHARVVSLARHDPLVVYQGFYYTQTELELYALAYLRTGTLNNQAWIT